MQLPKTQTSVTSLAKRNTTALPNLPPAPYLCPRPQVPLPFPSFPQEIGRVRTRLPSSNPLQASSSPTPNQKAPPPAETQIQSADPNSVEARRAPGRDPTKQMPPSPSPPSAASEFLPLPKRRRGLHDEGLTSAKNTQREKNTAVLRQRTHVRALIPRSSRCWNATCSPFRP